LLINNTKINVSRISFGTGSLHHLFSKRQRQIILQTAAYNGITHFDTSPFYGYGLAEIDLGYFLLNQRDKFTITTKIGLNPYLFSSNNNLNVWGRKLLSYAYPKLSLPVVNANITIAKNSFNKSLKNLKTDYIDFLFLHEPIYDLYNTEEYLRWFEDEQNNGKIRAYGIAGTKANILPFVKNNSPFSLVIQTKDSIENCEANFLNEFNKKFQFTYGYFSTNKNKCDTEYIISNFLKRNQTGSIIFSTKNIARLNSIAKILNQI
jgi:D-threo-aldose 1-dehydrogenase